MIRVAVGFALVAFWMGTDLRSGIPASPAEAVKSFYEREVAEDQLMDPLILAGPDVIPLLEQDLLDANVPRRRYAIGAVGNIGDRSALPTLRKILEDRSEVDYIRCDALEAMAMIDRDMAFQRVRAEPGLEAQCGAATLSGAKSRSYLEALLGWHY